VTQEQIDAINDAKRAAEAHMAESNKRLIQLVDQYMKLRHGCDHTHPDGISALVDSKSASSCTLCGRVGQWKRAESNAKT
jgi:hypothetical protein